MSDIFLSVVIPAFNEERRLAATLRDIRERLAAADFSYEVIIVDDGSTDQTRAVAREAGRPFSDFQLIANDANRGKGAVVRQGMLAARGQWRLFMDADNSTTIDYFFRMKPFLEKGYSVIFGSRKAAGAEMKPQPFYRRWLGEGGNTLVRLLGLSRFRDTQCGFKCFSAEAAENVFSSLRDSGWMFDIEALCLAGRKGFQIKEIPVKWVNDPDSRVRSGHWPKMLWDILKIRWRLWQRQL